MKADVAEKVSGWVCSRIWEPSSWVAVAAVLIGLSLVMSALMMSIVTTQAQWLLWSGIIISFAGVVALAAKERGNG